MAPNYGQPGQRPGSPRFYIKGTRLKFSKMPTPEEMSISPPIRRLRRTETLPTTKTTTTSTDGGGEIIMKAKKKRAGSFLCFGPPATDEIEDYYDEKDRPLKESPDVERIRKKKKKRLAKIVRSISMKSSPSPSKLTKDPRPSRLTSLKVSNSSENPLASESFGKNSDAQIFSSSSTTFSSSFSSSSSCSSVASSMAAALPKLQRKKSFLPPPGPRNLGYATGLTLVLLSLFVMVFCGRLTAILWTATWLCLLPRRQTAARRPPEFAERRRKGDCCGEEEKKRVVMEGFLQRNRKGGLN